MSTLRDTLVRYREEQATRSTAGTASVNTLMRNCRDGGVGLVPCDPAGAHCPPAERLAGTEYEHMYSVLGSPKEEQYVVRCVPPELIQVDVPPAAEPVATASPEVRELALDRRMRTSLRHIADRETNIHKLAAWKQHAPCEALIPAYTDDGQCQRMRFAEREAGGRCIQQASGQCQDNLAEMQRKVDRASTQLMRLVRRMKSKLQQLQQGTGEGTIDEALQLVARGMEDQVYSQHICSMHQGEASCNSEDQAHCRFENGQCQTYTCRAFHTQSQCKQEPSCTWNARAQPAMCESSTTCNDHTAPQTCGQSNECMWNAASKQCISGIDAVRHIIDVANMAEADHAQGGMLNEILVSKVQADQPWPERKWSCRNGNCRTTTDDHGSSRAECLRTCTVKSHDAKQPYARFDRVKHQGAIYQAMHEVPAGTELHEEDYWKKVPTMQGGGISGPRLGKLVRLMTRIMQQYHTLQKWSPKLQELMPTYRAAMQLDAACTAGNANCRGQQQHRMTEGLTWIQDDHNMAALPPAVFPQPPPFEAPTLQLE